MIMKQTRKILLIISAVLISLGVLMCGVSFTASGFNLETIGVTNMKVMEQSFAPDFSVIEIDAELCALEFSQSRDDDIHISYHIRQRDKEKRSIEIEPSQGRLVISEKLELKWYDYIRIFGIGGAKLCIELPQGMNTEISASTDNGSVSLENLSTSGGVKIETSNGKFEIKNVKTGGNLDLKTSNSVIEAEQAEISGGFTAQSSNGKIELKSVKAGGSCEARTSNARVAFENVKVGESEIVTSNGKVELEAVSAESMSIKTSNGKIEFSELEILGKRLEAESSNGAIEGCLVGSEGDYRFDCNTSNASVSTPKSGEDSTKSAYFKTSNGAINIWYSEARLTQ